MSERARIDPALGLDLVERRTLAGLPGASVAVVIPAHNEAATVAEVVTDAHRAFAGLPITRHEVIVSASGCTDDTAAVSRAAGARVIEAAAGKGRAILAGVAATQADIICLIDGDLRYYGDEPLAASLLRPILSGIADATISDLYWRPLYPQLWLYGFFAPVVGRLFPEMLPKAGNTPWSGQRAAVRALWPAELPHDFTSDLALLLHWNKHALRLRPVIADDWMNPQRPKPDLMHDELQVLWDAAVADERVDEAARGPLFAWYDEVHHLMAQYRPDSDDPQAFERQILRQATRALPAGLTSMSEHP